MDRVRIDKWLWAARLFKTRSMAAQAIALGRVRVDGERIKAAREARVGELLQVQVGDTQLEVQICALASMRGPAAQARLLYEETADSVRRREARTLARRLASEPARELKGRPTKRDGRRLRRLADETD